MSSDISKSSILARLSREENEDKFVEKDVERCLDDLWREREIYRKERSLMFFWVRRTKVASSQPQQMWPYWLAKSTLWLHDFSPFVS
jgi:hypothetical protein